MIDEHVFNTAWYGARAGIIRDPAALAAPRPQLEAALAPFAFVELRCKPGAADRARLTELGFFVADTQIHFRLGLAGLRPTPSLAGMELRWADDQRFTIETHEMAAFRHERFQHLPGMTATRLDARYAAWACDLVAASPATCVRVEQGGLTQGWFLAEPRGPRLRLALAMASAAANVSGVHLYLAACLGYAGRGHAVGEASFSVHNTSVLNIYAHLGARFVATEDAWLWINPGT